MTTPERRRRVLLTFQEQWRDVEEGRFIQWLQPSSDDHIFDIGTNTGQFLLKLRKQYGVTHAAGCDRNPKVANSELQIYPLAAEQLTGIADNSYSKVTMRHVLEHISDPGAALAEAYRILVPTGTIHLASFLHTPESIKHPSVTEATDDAPRQYTQADIVQLLTTAGFAVEQQQVMTDLSTLPRGDEQFPSLLIVGRKPSLQTT